MLPDLKLPIEDENAARFWLAEFSLRYNETGDMAFLEAHRKIQTYIEFTFDTDESWSD